MQIILGSRLLKKVEFNDENELEKVVWSNPEVIFGEEVVYVPQKSIETVGGISTVPDGIAINLSAEKWYIVEVELAKHGTRHITQQVTIHLIAADNPKTKRELVKTIIPLIQKSEKWKKKFADLGIAEIQIQSTLERIMEKPPILVIPIDAVPPDLTGYAKSFPGNEVVPILIEKYIENGSRDVAYRTEHFTTTLETHEEDEKGKKPLEPLSREEFLKQCDGPGRTLFNRLEELAKEKKHELRAKTQAFSYYAVSKDSRFCLLTLWPKSVTILKYNMNESRKIPLEAASKFRDEMVRIGNLENRYDSMKEPSMSTRDGDLSEYETQLFVSAFGHLLGSIT